jgi:hypothetical protein
MGNSSTKRKRKTKKCGQSKWRLEREKAGFYGNQQKVPVEDIKAFFEEFRDFHINDLENTETEHLTARRFCLKKGYSERTVEKWAHKYPEYARGWLEGKEAIADKREVGMLKKRLSEKATMYTMHNYSESWKKADEYHDDRAKRKNDDLSEKLKGLIFDVPQLDESER